MISSAYIYGRSRSTLGSAALLLILPFLLLASCADQLVTPAPEALQHHRPGHGGGDDGGDGTAYQTVTIPTLGGNVNSPGAIDADGMVVGSSHNSAGQFRAYGWTEAKGIHDLLASHSSGRQTEAARINGSGQVTGRYFTCDSEDPSQCHWQGYVYDMHSANLKVLPPLSGDNNTVGGPITDSRIVVGLSYRWSPGDVGAPVNKIVVWTPDADDNYGEPFDLGCEHDGFSGGDANARGDVVANCRNRAGRPHVWVRSGDGYAAPVVLGTNFQPGFGPIATGIDDVGRVVGWVVLVEDGRRAHLWHPDDYAAPLDLGPIGSSGFVYGINNQNQVVGTRYMNRGSSAAIWTVNDAGELVGVRELETPSGYNSAYETRISEKGSVVGRVSSSNGEHIAVLWRPVAGSGDGGDDDDCKWHPKTGECR